MIEKKMAMRERGGGCAVTADGDATAIGGGLCLCPVFLLFVVCGRWLAGGPQATRAAPN
jgi:hypothetical protein